MAYCSVPDIEGITGALTAAQVARATTLIDVAEAYINNATNRAWGKAAQTQEAHYQPTPYINLDYFPVTTVTAVYGRASLEDDEETLTVNVDYEVVDLAAGIIRIVAPESYGRIRVTYTPDTAVPADITQACAELVANWLLPLTRPNSYGLDSYSLPDLTVKFSRAHVQEAAPPAVQAILDMYRVPVHG